LAFEVALSTPCLFTTVALAEFIALAPKALQTRVISFFINDFTVTFTDALN
jgi:hypothetical protein